jgi:hypothetical protein
LFCANTSPTGFRSLRVTLGLLLLLGAVLSVSAASTPAQHTIKAVKDGARSSNSSHLCSNLLLQRQAPQDAHQLPEHGDQLPASMQGCGCLRE